MPSPAPVARSSADACPRSASGGPAEEDEPLRAGRRTRPRSQAVLETASLLSRAGGSEPARNASRRAGEIIRSHLKTEAAGASLGPGPRPPFTVPGSLGGEGYQGGGSSPDSTRPREAFLAGQAAAEASSRDCKYREYQLGGNCRAWPFSGPSGRLCHVWQNFQLSCWSLLPWPLKGVHAGRTATVKGCPVPVQGRVGGGKESYRQHHQGPSTGKATLPFSPPLTLPPASSQGNWARPPCLRRAYCQEGAQRCNQRTLEKQRGAQGAPRERVGGKSTLPCGVGGS